MAATGLGAFVALVLTLLHRWGATAAITVTGEPFVAGAFVGLAVTALLAALFCAKDAYRPSSASSAPALIGALAGALLTGIAYAGQVAAPSAAVWTVLGLPWGAWGMLAGCGLALIALLWSRSTSHLLHPDAFGCVAGAFGVAAVLDAVSLALPEAALHALVYAEIIWAAGAPLLIARVTPEPQPAAVLPSSTAAQRLHELVSQTWKPVVGAVICLFIFGFTWDTDTLGIQLSTSQSIFYEKIIGLVVAAAVIAALAWYGRSHDPMPMLLNAVLPVLVVTFIVRPYFLSLTLGGVSLALVGIARETGFVLFLAAAWLALTQAAPHCNVSASLAGAALVAPCGLAGLGGLYGPLVWGPVASYVGAILFTIYLVGIAIAATLGRTKHTVPASDTTPSPDQADERFAALVQTHNLTPRETDIALHLRRGHSYAYIANALTVSENTVRTHVRNIYRKLGVSSREELIAAIHGEDGA